MWKGTSTMVYFLGKSLLRRYKGGCFGKDGWRVRW
jgi:hypothetical protein